MASRNSIDAQTKPLFANAAFTDEWLQSMMASTKGSADGQKAATYMSASTAIVHGEITPCTAVPRLFDNNTKAVMTQAVAIMHSILNKVRNRYLCDPTYRALFGFDPRLEELILSADGKDLYAPFARYDIFLDETTGSYVFCELNADGSSGMNEDREVARAMSLMSAYSSFLGNHKLEGNELFESWIDTCVSILKASGRNPKTSHVAICDYLECATLEEFEEYRSRFEARGIGCSICDVRSLVLGNDGLHTSDGRLIDVIWRRCVTNDVLLHWDESQDFLEAARRNQVLLIGGFSGHLVHDKRLFNVLQTPETGAFLAEVENDFIKEHIPFTTVLDSSHVDIDEVKTNKNTWVIKPADHYGADEVHLGIEASQSEWCGLVDKFANKASGDLFLAQRFVRPYRTPTIPLANIAGDKLEAQAQIAEPRSYANLLGLYVYDGAFKGVFSRLGPSEIVTGLAGGLTAATFWVDCDRP